VKRITKQSQSLTLKQNKHVVINLDRLNIIKNEDEVLDFINTIDKDVKEAMLNKLSMQNDKDLVVFFTTRSIVIPNEVYYIVLIKIASSEIKQENGLLLAFSEDVNVVSYFLAESSNLTFEEAKNGFSKNDF
jgi:hypothetical protein